MTFQETNIPHLSTNDTTIVSFNEENIIIRTFVFTKQYPKRDYEDEINESFKPPQKCQPYCRYHACRMAFR